MCGSQDLAKVAPTAYINGPSDHRKGCGGPPLCVYPRQCHRRRGRCVGNSTELKNVILFNKVQVPHYNYVGDSILGYKSHMGAGSITSKCKI